MENNKRRRRRCVGEGGLGRRVSCVGGLLLLRYCGGCPHRARPWRVASLASHVGAHPGLTVGRGQFALAAFSGRRLTGSGHDMRSFSAVCTLSQGELTTNCTTNSLNSVKFISRNSRKISSSAIYALMLSGSLLELIKVGRESDSSRLFCISHTGFVN